MAHHSGSTGAPSEFAVWLGGLLMAVVAGEDLRVRQVIARAAARAYAGHALDLKTRWYAGPDLAADPRVE